jgi:hypothetical protein
MILVSSGCVRLEKEMLIIPSTPCQEKNGKQTYRLVHQDLSVRLLITSDVAIILFDILSNFQYIARLITLSCLFREDIGTSNDES